MVFSGKKIINSFTFHYFSIMFSLLLSPSPFVHLSLLPLSLPSFAGSSSWFVFCVCGCVLVCLRACVFVLVCVYVLIPHPNTLLPHTRLRWAATNYAEDQGEAWNCIRKASGLYVPLLSSQLASFSLICLSAVVTITSYHHLAYHHLLSWI